MNSLSEKLRKIQEEARLENQLKAEQEKQKAALKEEAELKRLRGYAEDQFADYVQKLEIAARNSPDSKKLKVDIGSGNDGGRIIAQRLVELFTEEGVKVTRHSSTTDNYYECGPHTFHWLEFEL